MFLLALALTAGLGQAPSTPPDTTRTIFGQWRYNPSLSDARQAYVGGLGAGGYGDGAMGGGGRSGGGQPPVAPRSPSDAQKAAHQELVTLALRAPTLLELQEMDGTLTVIGDSAAPISLSTDGRKVKWFTSDSVQVETLAKWEYGRLVVEHDVRRAGKVTYTFYLSPNGTELFVAVAVYPVGGPTRPVPYRRVYDPAEARPSLATPGAAGD